MRTNRTKCQQISCNVIQCPLQSDAYDYTSEQTTKGSRLMTEPSAEEAYIGIEDAAEYLGVKPVTLRSWIKKKDDLPAYRIGKLWRFKRSELDDWVSSGRSAMDKPSED